MTIETLLVSLLAVALVWLVAIQIQIARFHKQHEKDMQTIKNMLFEILPHV